MLTSCHDTGCQVRELQCTDRGHDLLLQELSIIRQTPEVKQIPYSKGLNVE